MNQLADPKVHSPIAKFQMKLLEFPPFKLELITSQQNVISDTLSRNPVNEFTEKDLEEIEINMFLTTLTDFAADQRKDEN